MKKQDARVTATRHQALTAALDLLCERGISEVTHQAISARTDIARSTLYRHWPDISSLLLETFEMVAMPPQPELASTGSLEVDLEKLLQGLVAALEETRWGQVVPQLIAAAAVDATAKALLNSFIDRRLSIAEPIIKAARERGDIAPDTRSEDILTLVIGPAYYRHLIAGLTLGAGWVQRHVKSTCQAFATVD